MKWWNEEYNAALQALDKAVLAGDTKAGIAARDKIATLMSVLPEAE